MAKERAWSYSALSAFELCPRKFYAEKVSRKYREKPNPSANYGQEVHKAFEDRLLKDKKLPLDLRHHEQAMKRLSEAPGESMPEQRLAINKDLQATGYFDDDVWCRGIVDFGKLNPPVLLIIDHKTGKVKEDFDQLDLMAALMFHHLEEVEKITAAYYWTKSKRMATKKYVRNDLADIWSGFLPRVEHMQDAFNDESFPARQNFLCKRHCPVKDCQFNGGV
jgi:hypothetical protein